MQTGGSFPEPVPVPGDRLGRTPPRSLPQPFHRAVACGAGPVNTDGLAVLYAPETSVKDRTPPVSDAGTGAVGCRSDFDTALVEHRPELLRYLRRRMGDGELAEDLAQETLSRMMKYREARDIDDRRLMLFRIANNLVLEFQRTRGRRHAAAHVSLADAGPLPAEGPSTEAIVDAQRAVDLLLKHTIAALPPKCRLAFMLNRFDGLSYPQVAERMGISVKMVEKHITRALLACRAAVGEREY